MSAQEQLKFILDNPKFSTFYFLSVCRLWLKDINDGCDLFPNDYVKIIENYEAVKGALEIEAKHNKYIKEAQQ